MPGTGAIAEPAFPWWRIRGMVGFHPMEYPGSTGQDPCQTEVAPWSP